MVAGQSDIHFHDIVNSLEFFIHALVSSSLIGVQLGPRLFAFCDWGIVWAVQDNSKVWLPSPPPVEKPRAVHNAACLAYLGDSIYEVCFLDPSSDSAGHCLVLEYVVTELDGMQVIFN